MSMPYTARENAIQCRLTRLWARVAKKSYHWYWDSLGLKISSGRRIAITTPSCRPMESNIITPRRIHLSARLVSPVALRPSANHRSRRSQQAGAATVRRPRGMLALPARLVTMTVYCPIGRITLSSVSVETVAPETFLPFRCHW